MSGFSDRKIIDTGFNPITTNAETSRFHLGTGREDMDNWSSANSLENMNNGITLTNQVQGDKKSNEYNLSDQTCHFPDDNRTHLINHQNSSHKIMAENADLDHFRKNSETLDQNHILSRDTIIFQSSDMFKVLKNNHDDSNENLKAPNNEKQQKRPEPIQVGDFPGKIKDTGNKGYTRNNTSYLSNAEYIHDPARL